MGSNVWLVRDKPPARRLVAGDNPVWSPDGSRLAFTGPNGAVRVMRANGTRNRALVRVTYAESLAWSPTGRALAFSDGSNVFVVQANGTGLRQIAAGSSVSWSSRGHLSYIKAGDDGRPALYALRLGSTERLLASGLVAPDVTEPSYAWAPRGGRVLFARRDGVYVVAAGGGEPERVVRGARWALWSPDERRLLFPRGLRLMTAPTRGGNPRPVARLPGPFSAGYTVLLSADWQALR
jgi:Tol biopolymer transport system component